jgi:hypothetical protein
MGRFDSSHNLSLKNAVYRHVNATNCSRKYISLDVSDYTIIKYKWWERGGRVLLAVVQEVVLETVL